MSNTVEQRVRCFRRADGQTIEGCDRIRFRSHGTCELVYRDDTFEVLPMHIAEAEAAVRRGIWVEVNDSPVQAMPDDPAAEIERLRARVAELEADNADFKKLIADELAETFRLFGAVGLNEADDFGTKTAIEAVRERIESIKADRDRWKTEALAARPFIDMGCIEAWQPDGFHPGIPTHIAYKAARTANGEVEQ